jgi:hypothetical protein
MLFNKERTAVYDQVGHSTFISMNIVVVHVDRLKLTGNAIDKPGKAKSNALELLWTSLAIIQM